MQRSESIISTIDFADSKKSSVKVNNNKKPIIGKDILELLTTGMYLDPLVIFREYIQNSVDSIDEALNENILKSLDESKIHISLDQIGRKIIITDNGAGIQNDKFIKIMTSVGDSKKRNTVARGMRGVGRLSGLAYCQELIFRSSSSSDKYVYQATWDCKLMRKLIGEENNIDFTDLLSSVVSFTKYEKKLESPHFFEVQINKPLRLKWDLLMNENKISDYLSQTAPVPFSNEFDIKDKIEKEICTKFKDYRCYNILLKVPNAQTEIEENIKDKLITKPMGNFFELNSETQDSIQDIEFLNIKGNDGNTAAIGWIAHSSYLGAIPKKELISGIRARVGNIMIGDSNIFNNCFSEQRFSSWAIGEIHILDQRIKPNGRRDNFEDNIHSQILKSEISLIANRIGNRCRLNSNFRNKLKHVSSKQKRAMELLKIIKENYLSNDKRQDYISESRICMGESEKALELLDTQLKEENFSSLISNHQLSNLEEAKKVHISVKKLMKDAQRISKKEPFNIQGISKVKLNAYREIFDLMLEYSNDRNSSARLIQKIIRKIESKKK
tara:strand:- start:263 stop:1930 length:1668 start_codon:yes stop_codon:yes gene_type:complete